MIGIFMYARLSLKEMYICDSCEAQIYNFLGKWIHEKKN